MQKWELSRTVRELAVIGLTIFRARLDTRSCLRALWVMHIFAHER